MTAYADTGWICSLYSTDRLSPRAVARMTHQPLPLPLTWLHHLELKNALRLKVFRREITQIERDESLKSITADLAAGILVTVTPSHADVTVEAERLSATYSETLGTRSLDILHVAMALVLGIDQMLTFDQRQAALAKAVGLTVQ